jgi:hypothetical protein
MTDEMMGDAEGSPMKRRRVSYSRRCPGERLAHLPEGKRSTSSRAALL